MRLWMSSEEGMNIVEDELSKLYMEIEKNLNTHLDAINYKNVLDEWWLIIILRDDDIADEERGRKKTSKIKGKPIIRISMSLKIPYNEFKNANEEKRKELIYDVILRSVDILEQKKIKNLEPIRDFLLNCKK